jgi:hypothetical protein
VSSEWSTHDIEMTADRVVKRFRSCGDGEHLREWQALTLLDCYVPGIAPAPLTADLAADPPVVVMTRLPGQPLRGGVVSPRQIKAMAQTLARMFDAVPASVATELPDRRWSQRPAEAAIRSAIHGLRADVPAEIRGALTEGLRWLDTGPFGSGGRPDVPPVFGHADGNLANFLWDGDGIRIVDFEDSGRSDRAYELADVTEHVASWVDTDFDVSLFLGHVSLSPAEQRRLIECRRLVALLWLPALAAEDPEHPRNPPGTAGRQADRVLRLLG